MGLEDLDAVEEGERTVEGVGGVVDVDDDELSGVTVEDDYVVELPLPEGEGECDGETLPLLEAVCVIVIVADAVPDTVLVKNAVGSVALGDGEFDPLLLLKPVPEVVEQPLVEGETLDVAEHEGSAP